MILGNWSTLELPKSFGNRGKESSRFGSVLDDEVCDGRDGHGSAWPRSIAADLRMFLDDDSPKTLEIEMCLQGWLLSTKSGSRPD